MPTVERTILIHAPVQKVFDYVSEPTNLPEVWPSMVDVNSVNKTPTRVGDTFHWVYKMAGMRVEGDGKNLEFVPNQRIVSRSTGGIPNTIDWNFQQEGDQTRVTIKTDYEIPRSLLGRLAEPFLIKLNEREADALSQNLKERMEAVPVPA